MSKKAKNRLGKNIRELRARHGWSQEELADKIAMNRNHIGAIERGESNITLESLLKIANAFNVTLSELVQGL